MEEWMVIEALVEAIVDGLGNAAGLIFISILIFIADTYRRILNNAERVKTLEGYMIGDEDNPNTPGLLYELHETQNRLDKLYKNIDGHQQKVEFKIDSLIEELDEKEKNKK